MKKNASFDIVIYSAATFSALLLCLLASRMFAQDRVTDAVVYKGAGYESPFKTALPEKADNQEGENLPPKEEISLPALTVKGVIWGGRFPQAILNDTVVREGDRIEEAKVLEISKDEIKLEFKGKVFILNTHSDSETRE